MTDSGNRREDQRVDTKVFMKLAGNILPDELLPLSTSLGIDNATLQTIRTDERDHKAMVYKLLQTWYQSKYDEATIRVLNKALEDIGRSDLIKFTDSRGFGNSGPTSSRAIDTKVVASDATTGDSATPPADMYYKMKSKPLGKCLILTYTFKGDGALERHGNDRDEQNLKAIFGQSNLGFDVEHHRDLNLKSTQTVVKEMSEKYHGDCFVLFVCSHGDEEGFFTNSDSEKMSIQEVIRQFDVNHCASLAGKPKLFFFNTCRGDASNEMTELLRDSTNPPAGIGTSLTHYIPREADCCVVLSTVPGYESLRSKQEGSFFVTNFCECLKENYKKLHLLDILTLNNANMINKAQTDERFVKNKSKICQVATTITNLSKAVYFVDTDK